MLHLKRVENTIAQEVVIILPGYLFHDVREQDIIGIGISERTAGFKQQRLAEYPLFDQRGVLLLCVSVRQCTGVAFTHRIANTGTHCQ